MVTTLLSHVLGTGVSYTAKASIMGTAAGLPDAYCVRHSGKLELGMSVSLQPAHSPSPNEEMVLTADQPHISYSAFRIHH